MQGSRKRWSAPAAAALAMTLSTVLALPAEATAARTRVAGSLTVADSTVAPGEPVLLTGELPPRRSRTVKLQTLTAGSWKSLATKQSSRRGGFRFTVESPLLAGARKYRVLAPAATLAGRSYPAVVTPTRTLTVVTMLDVDMGWQHACAVASDRRAWCWGDNTYGELGDGTPVSSSEKTSDGPVPVIGTGWTSITTGGASTCGLKQDATAWCWGEHASFRADPTLSSTPQQLEGQWRQISQAGRHACGVHTDGTGWCWGDNSNGQLGTTTAPASQTPLQLPGAWRQVVAGGGGSITTGTTCGIKDDLSAECWGLGTSGQLGNGAAASSATPVVVAGEHDWASLTVGESHTCGVDTDGAGWCWGANFDGRLGDGTFAEAHAPVRVTVSGTWATLDAGLQHTCGSTLDGVGWCWGWNDHGQLGDGTTTTVYWPAPKAHQLPGTWADVDAGFFGSVGITAPGLARAWGDGDHGELGRGPGTSSLVPLRVPVDP